MKTNKSRHQASQYDKIFKENIEAVLPSLMRNLLKITAVFSEEIPDDIQHTKERKPDFLKKITDENNNTFILHLEIQVADEPEMVYRMLEYKSMLLRKYKLPVRQFVIFIGKTMPKMQSTLIEDKLNFSFDVISFKTLSYKTLIVSDQPEEIVFSVLANFGIESPEKAIEQIIHRLDETSKSSLTFQKYLRQLRIFAKLRKLDLKIDEIMESIVKYIDEERDVLYIRGQKKEKEKLVKNLLTKSNHTLAEIADFASVSIDFVISVQQQQILSGK